VVSVNPSKLLRTILNPTSELLPVIPADLRPSVLHQPRVPQPLDPAADKAEVEAELARQAWSPCCEARLNALAICPICGAKVRPGDELRSEA
jgi:hypothetical protein